MYKSRENSCCSHVSHQRNARVISLQPAIPLRHRVCLHLSFPFTFPPISVQKHPQGMLHFKRKISPFQLRGMSVVYRAHNTTARTPPQAELNYSGHIKEKHSPQTASSAAPWEQILPFSGSWEKPLKRRWICRIVWRDRSSPSRW